MSDFLRKDKNMNLIRFGIIAGAHLVVLAIIYLMSGIGNGDAGDEQVATAGANGIVNWSSKDPGAQSTTVTGSGFDDRATDLAGFNEGDAILATQTQAPAISSRQRFEPMRPGGSSSKAPPSGDDGVLTPVGGQAAGGYQQPANIISREKPSQIIRYTIKRGDSLWGISKKFGVSTDELNSVNPGLTVNIQPGQVLNVPRPVASSTSAEADAPVPQYVEGSTYTVKSGDVLSRIAASQGVTLNALRAANNLRGDLIKVGQKLVVPNRSRPVGAASGSVPRKQGLPVVVKPGDSLFSIAERYNVSAKDLILYNNIQNPALINAGQTILIPRGGSGPIAPVTSSEPVRTVQPVAVVPVPKTQLVPEDAPFQLIDEDDVFKDETLIEQPVIPIED